MELEAADAGADEDAVEVADGFVDIGRKLFLHSDWGATSSYITGYGQEIFHRNHLDLLVAGGFGEGFEVNFGVAGNYAYYVARLVSVKHEGLEYSLYRFSKACGNVGCSQVALIIFVGDERVCYSGTVEQPCGICFFYSFLWHYSAKS